MMQASNAPAGGEQLDLSAVPQVQLDPEIIAAHNIVGFDSRDKRSRPFNLMRTQLMKRMSEEGARLVGITSATPAAGKSFLSVNLAASLSRLQQGTTVLVDLDLRRGCVAEELGLQFDKGVSDFLSGAASLSDLGVRIEGSDLVIIPTHTASSDSAEAIAGPRFEQLIAALRDQDSQCVVIFDLPPVFANDDAALTLGLLDGYVIVVDSGKTSKRQLTDAIAMLDPVPCLGAVLNRYAGGILDTYGYGSSYYDGYYAR